jgi:hypothetical protein
MVTTLLAIMAAACIVLAAMLITVAIAIAGRRRGR